VAELTGVSGPTLMQGRPLVGADLSLRPHGAPAGALCEWRGDNSSDFSQTRPAIRCFVTDDWKLVHYDNGEDGELYDRQNDPEEFHNLFHDPAHRETVHAMRTQLLDFLLDSDPKLPRSDLF
jgi:arylsulfatase A-like enzyme